MDATLFAKMLADKDIIDLKKLGYKYPQADMKEFVALLGSGLYHCLLARGGPGSAVCRKGAFNTSG